MSAARRNLKEADAISSDSTNRNRIQGRRGGAIRQWTETPDRHRDTHAGRSGERRAKVAELTPGRSPVSSPMPSSCGSRAWTHGRSRRQRRDRRREKSAEAVVVRSSDDGANQSGQRTSGRPTIPRKSGEGPNLCCQGASRRRLDGFGATARRTRPIPTRGADGGGAPRRDRRRRNRSGSVRGVASIHGVRPSTSLDHGLDLGPDHGRDRNRVLDGKDLRWHEFAPSPSTGKGEQGGAGAGRDDRRRTRTLARRASTGTDGVASGRDVRAESGARGADPQAGRAKRRDAAIGHPDGRRPTGAAVDPAGAGTFAGPHLFELELRLPSPTRNARRSAEGEGIRGGGPIGRGGRGPGKVLRPGEPRHPDVAAGSPDRRQTSSEDRASLPASGHDAGRRLHRAKRRGRRKGAAVAAVGEPASGRLGQGAGTAWASLLPVRGRLQHLRAVEGGGRAACSRR